MSTGKYSKYVWITLIQSINQRLSLRVHNDRLQKHMFTRHKIKVEVSFYYIVVYTEYFFLVTITTNVILTYL